VANDPPVGRYLGLAAQALGHVSGGLLVDVGLLGGYLRDGIDGFAAFAGPEPDDLS
jgi:hypothetical protein